MPADAYAVRAVIEPGRSMDNQSMPRAQVVGFLHGLADGLAHNGGSELAQLTIAPAGAALPSFSDLGDSLVRFQGGTIILRGFGCASCGNAHWAEDDPVSCPQCGHGTTRASISSRSSPATTTRSSAARTACTITATTTATQVSGWARTTRWSPSGASRPSTCSTCGSTPPRRWGSAARPSPSLASTRKEEHAELAFELNAAAAGRGNLSRIARELADVLYVSYGTAWAFGIDLDAAFEEVHRAAMDKIRAGLRREDGKILKPPGFRPPDMTAAVRRAHLEPREPAHAA